MRKASPGGRLAALPRARQRSCADRGADVAPERASEANSRGDTHLRRGGLDPGCDAFAVGGRIAHDAGGAVDHRSVRGDTAPLRRSSRGSRGLNLDQAVQMTIARNEQAKIADLNVVVADAAVEKAFTAFLPVLTAGGHRHPDGQRRAQGALQRRHRGADGQPAPAQRVPRSPLQPGEEAGRRAACIERRPDSGLLGFGAARRLLHRPQRPGSRRRCAAPARKLQGQPRRHAGARPGPAGEHERRDASQGRHDERAARARDRQGQPRQRVHPARVHDQRARAGERGPARAHARRGPAGSWRAATRSRSSPSITARTSSPSTPPRRSRLRRGAAAAASSRRWASRARRPARRTRPAPVGQRVGRRSRSPGQSSTPACATRTSTRATRRPTSPS